LIRSAVWCGRGALGAALLGNVSNLGLSEQSHGGGKNFPRWDLPHLVGEANRLADLLLGEAGLSRLRDMVLDAGYAVAPECGAERHELSFGMGQLFHFRLPSFRDSEFNF
jgi:hypothetical protein